MKKLCAEVYPVCAPGTWPRGKRIRAFRVILGYVVRRRRRRRRTVREVKAAALPSSEERTRRLPDWVWV